MSKTVCFLYVVAASKDPHAVNCYVPYEVNKKIIFFGPCKKKLREYLIKTVLGKAKQVSPKDNFYVVGVNGSNTKKTRNIIWCGKIDTVMTFESAFQTLRGSSFEKMRNDEESPLQFEPQYDENNNLIGYKHCSNHHPYDWPKDITSKRITVQGEYITLSDADFNRDCCFTCENIFYANGQGMPITDKMMEQIKKSKDLQDKQLPDQENPSYYCFGRRKDRSSDGFTGSYVTLENEPAERLIELIKNNIKSSEHGFKEPIKHCGGC